MTHVDEFRCDTGSLARGIERARAALKRFRRAQPNLDAKPGGEREGGCVTEPWTEETIEIDWPDVGTAKLRVLVCPCGLRSWLSHGKPGERYVLTCLCGRRHAVELTEKGAT